MAVQIEINGKTATIVSGEWTSESPSIANILNNWTRTNLESPDSDNPLYAAYSPENPYPDLTVAEAAAKAWKGKVIKADPPPDSDPDLTY